MIDKKSFALGLAVGGKWNLLRLGGGGLFNWRRAAAVKHPRQDRAGAAAFSARPGLGAWAEGWLFTGQAEQRSGSAFFPAGPALLTPPAPAGTQFHSHSLRADTAAFTAAASAVARVSHDEMENDLYA